MRFLNKLMNSQISFLNKKIIFINHIILLLISKKIINNYFLIYFKFI